MSELKRYLFLDIDGVLNTNSSLMENVHLLPEKVKMLQAIVDDTKCQIIISSSWRISLELRTLKELLYRSGLRSRFQIIGVTRNFSGCRGEEVQEFLLENPCDSYVILDDSTDFLEIQKDNLVRIDPEIGLTWQDAMRVRDLLLR